MAEIPDIEDLKVHKIAPRPKKKKRSLTIAGQLDASDSPDIDEAFGGSGESLGPINVAVVTEAIVETLRSIYDPEIPLNVYDLGLIYGVDVSEDGEAFVRMTLTAPACPVAGMIVTEVATKVGKTEGVSKSHVKLVWDPPWTKDRMSEDALLELGLL